MTDRDDVDGPFLDALGRHELVFARTSDDRSVLTEHEGRTVLVACTERAILARWWAERSGPGAGAPFVRELSFRQLVGLWAAPDVDLLVDPDATGGVLVPVAAARVHLGMGPVVADGDGAEPLPFAGFTGSRQSLRLPLMAMLIAVVVVLLGAARPDVRLVAGGLLGIVLSYLLGRRGFGELRAAARASRRLRESDRRRPAA
jgi:hypothetical protein